MEGFQCAGGGQRRSLPTRRWLRPIGSPPIRRGRSHLAPCPRPHGVLRHAPYPDQQVLGCRPMTSRIGLVTVWPVHVSAVTCNACHLCSPGGGDGGGGVTGRLRSGEVYGAQMRQPFEPSGVTGRLRSGEAYDAQMHRPFEPRHSGQQPPNRMQASSRPPPQDHTRLCRAFQTCR